MTDRASAHEPSLQTLVSFSQEKLSDLKKVVKGESESRVEQSKEQFQVVVAVEQVGNIKEEKKEKREQQEKRPELKIPEVIDDPQKIERAVQFASQATGVRKDFLMGMLVVESDLGRNPGKCTYEEVENGAQIAHENGQLSLRAWETFQDRRETMKIIANKLGYDYKQLRVSCNPVSYAGTGGAMGIPQFMPDIWMAYEDKVATIVGKENPDPWDIKDGVVAMALLLADTPGVKEHNLYAERNAAKMYLSGTTHWQYDWYANEILYWAQNYRLLLV